MRFLHIKIENNYKQVPCGAENRMALVRWLLEDLIITDTSKENVFELQENYPCCSRDMVITAGNREHYKLL